MFFKSILKDDESRIARRIGCLMVVAVMLLSSMLLLPSVEAKGGGAPPATIWKLSMNSAEGWSLAKSGGSSGMAASTNEITTAKYLSTPSSIRQMFSGGNNDGTDNVFMTATSQFLYLRNPQTVSVRFMTEQYTHNLQTNEFMKAGLRIRLYNSGGTLIESFDYWLSSWGPSISDPNHEKSVYRTPLYGWQEFTTNPMLDFPSGQWGNAITVDMQLFVQAGRMNGDSFSMCFDDLIVTQGYSSVTYLFKGASTGALSGSAGQTDKFTFDVPTTAGLIYATLLGDRFAGPSSPLLDVDLSLWDSSTPAKRTGGYINEDHSVKNLIGNAQYSGRLQDPEWICVKPVASKGQWKMCVANMADVIDIIYTVRIEIFLLDNTPGAGSDQFVVGVPQGPCSMDVTMSSSSNGLAATIWNYSGVRTGGYPLVCNIPYSQNKVGMIEQQVTIGRPMDFSQLWKFGSMNTGSNTYYYHLLNVVEIDFDGDGTYDQTEAAGGGNPFSNRWAIIVASNVGADPFPDFENSAKLMYKAVADSILRPGYGYADSHIYFLCLSPSPPGTIVDADGDGDNDKDDVTSYTSIGTAFAWMATNSDSDDICLVYMMDHGWSTGFCVPGGAISPTLMDAYLDGVTCARMTVVIECCLSGMFLPQIEATNRIAITSSQSGELSYSDEANDYRHVLPDREMVGAFACSFVKALRWGYTVHDSFDQAYSYVDSTINPRHPTSPQHPVINIGLSLASWLWA